MVHCIERALERYGLALNMGDIKAMQAQIGPATKVPVYGSVYLLTHAGRPLLAAVAPDGCIATFLPPDAYSAKARRSHRQQTARKSGKRRR